MLFRRGCSLPPPMLPAPSPLLPATHPLAPCSLPPCSLLPKTFLTPLCVESAATAEVQNWTEEEGRF